MKKLGFTVFVLLSSLTGIAQNVSYTKIFDDPDKVAPLKITLDPTFMDLYGVSFVNVGVGARVNYTFKKLATIEASSRISLLDPNADGGPKHHSFSELIATYHFSDKTFDANLPVTLSSSSTTYTTTTKYINVGAKKRKIKGLRLGFYKSFTNLELDYAKYKSPFVVSTTGGEVADFVNGSETHTPSYRAVFGMRTTVVNIGISLKNITNLKVNVDGYKFAKKHRRENDIYLDALFGLGTKFDDVIAQDGTIWTMNNDKLKKVGFRMGYIMKRGAFSYKTEISSRPGVSGGNFSFLQGFSFTIPVSLGQKPEILN
jgi:hypothetical protein